jgi:hypothetical protein
MQQRQMESKRIKNTYHTNINQKKARLAVLILDKVVFRAKKITVAREEFYIIIKKSIYQKDTLILNLCTNQ